MKPVIGIFGEIGEDLVCRLKYLYAKAIEKAGGLPILLPYLEDEGTLDAFLSLCDGFLFSGGADIAPERYGAVRSPACGESFRFRDDLEFRALPLALRTQKPILAICRGTQLINAFLGGTLYQDLPTEYKESLIHVQAEPSDSPSHKICILEETPLFRLVGKKEMPGNSFHHQAIKTLGQGLLPMAVAEDGVIEGIFSPSHPYLRGYQWHPERLFEAQEDNALLFRDFVAACSRRPGVE